ncbi:hypothetical protein M407DRAFT_246239 [Tulasnella calospora MUT 4182]|uniref:Secreted protein n=1 Tax=Tulasnella calospora MUT 4182 TaxID=1051891 RepID=A0A0C3PT55_9AGAM|nr:hypothetical protein M407DRAFT_246605 [Tulasnella calospora MUT 4182]KIO19243.1 hypothetical protein M407DRAFT_246239 [Tulasnella calospora MUT 4182]
MWRGRRYPGRTIQLARALKLLAVFVQLREGRVRTIHTPCGVSMVSACTDNRVVTVLLHFRVRGQDIAVNSVGD